MSTATLQDQSTQTDRNDHPQELEAYQQASGFHEPTEPAAGQATSVHRDILPAAYVLSDRLTELGETLSHLESCIMDAGQTLDKKFQHGRAVSVVALKRIVMRYHRNVSTSDEFKRALHELGLRGLCRLEGTRLRIIKHSGAEPAVQLTKFHRIVSDERQIEILLACKACCGTGWAQSRNIAARAAVKALIQARHDVSKDGFKGTIRQLKQAGIIEEVQSKGTSAFRLTMEASIRMNVELAPKNMGLKQEELDSAVADLPQLNRDEVLHQFDSDEQRSNLMHGGDQLSPLACCLASEVMSNREVLSIEVRTLWQAFRGRGFTFTEFRRAVGELVACERAMLFEAKAGNRTACHLELMNVNTKSENVPIFYAMEYAQQLEPGATVG